MILVLLALEETLDVWLFAVRATLVKIFHEILKDIGARAPTTT